MNWFTWRQHRKQFLIFGLSLLVYAAVVIPTGIHFWHVFQNTTADCTRNPAIPTCTDLSASSLFPTTMDRILTGIIPTLAIFLPIILGLFWGAPFLAREYTEGTNSLAWTQSVSRRKWLTIKLAWMLAATLVFTTLVAILITWFSKTTNALDMDRFSNGNEFGIQGVLPVAIALFAVSWGILFGAWFRKVMVAVGATLVLIVAVSHIVVPNLIRPNYMKPVSVSAPFGPARDNGGGTIPQNAWVTSQTIYDGHGRAVLGDVFPAAPSQCQQLMQQQEVPGSGGHAFKAPPSPNGGDPIAECLDKAGWTQVTKYQPAYRYWDFQRIEASIYLGLTAMAVIATYGFVLKRDA